MKTLFLKIIVMLGLLLGLLCNASDATAARPVGKLIGSGKLITKTVKAPKFNAIAASRGVEVVIGGTEEIVIRADDNVMEYVVVEEKNGTLQITTNYEARVVRNIHVKVQVPNNGRIASITASSGADIRTKSALKAETMNIRLSSGASMDAALKADDCTVRLSSGTALQAAVDFGRCDIRLSSGSSVELSGKAAKFGADLSSGSSLEAFGLVTETCSVEVSSGASAEVTCTEKLTAHVSSGASVEYKGDCSVDKQASSGGSVRKR
ncbi:MAG: DUF2807 domain-containing protein [Alistipes senegalensis]|nr:DUF2807 domain-containing protein [Bacteroides cellulosilyticus]MCM1351818.1 DUF2807 domain-containing protein [Alistipes senegalensis]